ncbi:ubiquitin carboxyl-terminal hydrolase CYLD [Episyrphus balteatus]|uniref:ubiquitin carboxyl-terminal hydrolase CYLD n=1 Tax=Episyrphus balteatus TaxID=286459 RepID=UPI0024859FCB|nr:ubiquitin carboxyl-terminal hydrolase CYLD [Episyrphus balteatus]
MEVFNTKYAVLTKRTDLRLDLCALQDEKENEKIPIEPGTLVKVYDTTTGGSGSTNNNTLNNNSSSQSNSNSNSKTTSVQILDYFNHNPISENLYECPTSHLKRIHQDIWPFGIAISDPTRRLQFFLSTEQCKHILYLREGELVAVNGALFGNAMRYECIVRYIGLVQEMGPGYYFGLQIRSSENVNSPQELEIPYVINYMQCDPRLALIVSADWIEPIDIKKKSFPRELLCGTIDKARSAIGLTARQSTSRKSYKKSPTKKDSLLFPQSETQFYVPSPSAADDYASSSGCEEVDTAMDRGGRSLATAQNPKHPRKDNKPTTITHTFTKEETTISLPVPQTQQQSQPQQQDQKDKSNQSDEDLVPLDNEDYNKYVENYERNLEQRQLYEQQQQNIPPGILKSSKPAQPVANNPGGAATTTVKKKTVTTSIEVPVKPVTIMSLEDRDIIVIDKADIKESTKNEANVIVVDNPRQTKEVDLADLLGGNWPNNAGDAAMVLNTTALADQNNKLTNMSNGGANTTTTANAAAGGSVVYVSSSSNSSVSSMNQKIDSRSKSANPISHLVGTKSLDRKNRDPHWAHSDLATISGTSTSTGIGSGTGDGMKKEKKLRNTIEPLYDNVNTLPAVPQSIALASPEEEFIQASPMHDVPGTNLGVGSMVEVSTETSEDLYGVIRWIGCPPSTKTVMVGVELEDEQEDKRLPLTDGVYNGARLFKCQEGRALFLLPNQVAKDRRFVEIDTPQGAAKSAAKTLDSKMFGQVECPSVPGAVSPLKIYNLDELEEMCGKFKGIQGHHNSCYLDATLFSMFTFTSVFDSLLFRPPEPEDISHYEEVQKVLREEIVNPLRKNMFVRADRVMKLRQLLDKLSSVSGLTSEEKDPEEFLNSLLAQILRAEPFLKLSSGQDAFYYQLFVEKDERLSFPSVQQLFEQSFLSSDIKLKEVPSCLIIQMPRFGKNFKMYPRILPSQVLDVTDIIEDSPRQCSVCGKLAEYECKECFGILQCGVGLESTAFCRKCLETVHSHAKRANHTPKEISVPHDFKIMVEHLNVPRLFMELFAVVCIETSHYVAFVKAGSGLDAPWCFFDSMADRKGEQNGYNIPEMISVPDLPQWLSEEGARAVNETSSNDKMLPEHAKRLFCDAYMCMYQSTDVMMYR